MTYYFINRHQSFVKHKNLLGTSNVVSPVNCYMLKVFLSQWPERSCFICCLSVSTFFTHQKLVVILNKQSRKDRTVFFNKSRNISKGWSYRFLSQSITRLGRHCKRNLMKIFFFLWAQTYLFKPHTLTCLLCNVWKLQSSKHFLQYLHEFPDLISSCRGNGMFSLSNCIFCAMISFICAVVRNGTPSS